MVAYKPRSPQDDSSRSLSPDVAARLRSALGAHWAQAEGYEAELRAALQVAAQDARARGMRPEELLLAMKAVEEDVAVTLEVEDTQDRDRFRIWLVGVCMRAFFAEGTQGI
jgi:AMMECR1 domain-containing protein